jgi:hypothetical protein
MGLRARPGCGGGGGTWSLAAVVPKPAVGVPGLRGLGLTQGMKVTSETGGTVPARSRTEVTLELK